MTDYAVSLVARTPASSGGPTLVEVDRLVCSTIQYVDNLNKPGSAQLTCPLNSLSDAAKTRLVNLAQFPCEVWIYQDSSIVWAGGIETILVQDTTNAQINAVDLLGYTFRMGIMTDQVFSAVEQFTIGKTLVDQFQALSYGNYGIDTSSIGSSGQVRDRTYLQVELHNVGQRLAELGAVLNGFDIWVDPITRKLNFAYPTRGMDLSQSVIFDRLNLASAQVAISVAPGDLASECSATGTSQAQGGTGLTLYSDQQNTGLEATFGRSWNSQNYQGVSLQPTLDGYAAAYLAARSTPLLQPGPTVLARPTSPAGGFHVGDTVGYAYDAGLGFQSGNFRIAQITTTVGSQNDVNFQVVFA